MFDVIKSMTVKEYDYSVSKKCCIKRKFDQIFILILLISLVLMFAIKCCLQGGQTKIQYSNY